MMKKIMALLLVLVMVMALAACGDKTDKTDKTEDNKVQNENNENENNENENNETENNQSADASGALVILQTIWDSYAEEDKFFVSGGDMNTHLEKLEADENYEIPSAPGEYNLEYMEDLSFTMVISQEDLANVDEAATMVHGMNANNFTCGAFHLKEGTDVAAFASNVKESVKNNQWMCGQPEVLRIVSFGDGYVLVAFGINDAMEPFQGYLTGAYADAELLVEESLI